MTEEELAKIRQRCEAASQRQDRPTVVNGSIAVIEFLAVAREDVFTLLAEVKRLRVLLEVEA